MREFPTSNKMTEEQAKFFNCNEIALNLEKFYKYLHDLVKLHVPHRIACPSTYPVWYSKELISHIISKKKIHKIWLQTNSLEDYIEYKKLRAKCIRLSRTCYQDYILNVESKTSKNVKHFWNYFNKLKKDNGIPSNMFLNDVKADNVKDVCDLFSKHFKSVYHITSPNIGRRATHIFESGGFDLREINEADITIALGKMKVKPSVGPDRIP